MKKLLFGIVLLFNSFGLFAQNSTDYLEVQRDVLKTEKKALIAEAMELTEAESPAFWSLYNEYNEKMFVINTKLFNLIKDYSEHYENMSNDKAVELWTNAMNVETELLKLEKNYFKKFLKILPGTKAVRYLQAENKVKNLVDAQLSLQVPLFQDKK
jgi:hypothetical protein